MANYPASAPPPPSLQSQSSQKLAPRGLNKQSSEHSATMCVKAREKQATKKMVRVVCSSPNTLQTVFEKFSLQQDLAGIRPDCTCTRHIHTLRKFGTATLCDGLVALTPISLNRLRPQDPLPINGLRAQAIAIKAITAFAQQVQGQIQTLKSASHVISSTKTPRVV